MQMSRVILANEPRLLRGLLQRVLSRVPGLAVVGEVSDPAQLAPMVDQSEPQWVIVSIWPEGSVPSVIQPLLGKPTPPGILGMAADGSQVKVMTAGTPEETRGGLSLDDLIAILNKRA
jgi:DNA-binding NarL/FixJ family response regulator